MSSPAPAVASFAPSYRAARRLFMDASAAAGLTLQTFAHPLPGAEGEALAMDVARAGGFEATTLLVISSACHGVEGHCGSGVQHALLSDATFMAEARAAGVALLFVHALNPHGFSHGRRVTHEGVDLNRNFLDFTGSAALPANPGYDALALQLVPPTWPPTPENEAALAAYAQAHGERGLQQAITGGQYRHPQGLFYGGTAPTWSAATFAAVLREHATRCSRLGWIDLHTGLGPQGHGEKIWGGRDEAAALARARAWWGAEVTSMYDGSSTSARLQGLLTELAYRHCAQAEITPMALEYGTEPTDEVIQCLRSEQWLEMHPQAEAATRTAIKRRFRDAFYTDTPAWKQAIVEQGLAAARQAVAGLAA